MPNMTVYLNKIKEFEGSVGFPIINGEELAKTLQTAWKQDATEAKLDYLGAYREVFLGVLKKWSDSELSFAFSMRSEKMPDLKKCLLETDKALKLCAMALLPELRENLDVLSNMTFGVMDTQRLKNEFVTIRKKYLEVKEPENVTKKRKETAYVKYQKEWEKTTTRNITEMVRDQEALRLMSQDEKIDYALALDAYRHAEDLKRPLGSSEKELIDDALQAWKQELGCLPEESLDSFVEKQYALVASKLAKQDWLDNQVNEAIAEYNQTLNPAQKEIDNYKDVVTKAIELQRQKEGTNPSREITDDTAEMVGDFFMQEELSESIQEAKEAPNRKERVFLQEKVEKFNQEYSLDMSHDKLRTSIEQLSSLMIKAREEKQRFLDENSVVVIENGKETCYAVKDYYKETIDDANKTCADELQKIAEERLRAEKEHATLLEKLESQSQILGKEIIENIKAENEKKFKEKREGFDKAIAKARAELAEKLSTVKGGFVIEKNGNKTKQHKSSRYYETHETQKEQYAYGEYQRMYSRIYKDACKKVKERNYAEGRVANFSHVAKDIDQLFKSAMYVSNVYDNDRNLEIIQKCSYGGLSAEKLASYATHIAGDDWGKEQHSDAVWTKQSDKARKLLAQWGAEAKNNKTINPGDKVKGVLEKSLTSFNKGEITRKQMLDNMLAGEVHLQMAYPSNFSKLLNLIRYRRARNAMSKCRSALGISETKPLNFAMKEEYSRMAKSMSKEQIFKSVEERMNYALDAKQEKLAFEKEHKIVQDKELARKESELNALKAKDKEPLHIPELDERKLILSQGPRVKPIVPTAETQRTLNNAK